MADLLGKIGLKKSLNELHFARQADTLRLKGNTKKAIQLCRDGLKQRPSYVTGYYILARCLIDEGQEDRARTELTEALRHEPHNMAVLTELAALHESDGDREDALNYYSQALAIDPLNNRVRNLVQRLRPKTDTPEPSIAAPQEQVEEQVEEIAAPQEQVEEETQEESVSETIILRTVSIPTREEAIDAGRITTAAPGTEIETPEETMGTTPSPESPSMPESATQTEKLPAAPVFTVSGAWVCDMFGAITPAADPPLSAALPEGSALRFIADTFEAMTGISESIRKQRTPSRSKNHPLSSLRRNRMTLARMSKNRLSRRKKKWTTFPSPVLRKRKTSPVSSRKQ
ncbi:MAG: tetratricopeptide repeat protein [candidate division Zixibacteria bacterium]|nr:tetratricopeptide repeat protein [candidate division Zixibacteria bacterium]